MKTQFLFATVKTINEEQRTLDAVVSTRDIDRHGDIVLPSAFVENIDSFKANPVILATHQHRLDNGSSPVIGSAIPETIQIGKTDVTFTMRFATTALGEEYWQLYKDKHMRAFSIGFIPIEWTDEEDEQAGYIRTYTKIELLEVSAVPVPSNRRALARAKGYFDDDDNTDSKGLEAKFDKRIKEIETRFDEDIEMIKAMIVPDRDGLAELLMLDGNPEQSDHAEGDKIAEQQLLNSLEKAISKG